MKNISIIEEGRKSAYLLKNIVTIDDFDTWCHDNDYTSEEIGSGLSNQTIFIAKTEDKLVASFLYGKNEKLSCLEFRKIEDKTFEAITIENIELVNNDKESPHNVQKNLFLSPPKKNTMIYFSCPTGKRRDAIVAEFGDVIGACLTPTIFNNITARKMPWFFDNGAFMSFSHNVPYDKMKFCKRLQEIYTKSRMGNIKIPDFVVIPDVVGGGSRSLTYSMKWMEFLETTKLCEFNYYLAIQDGMSIAEVENVIRSKKIDGLFLGGTKPWKYATGEKWCRLADKYNMKIHVGGVGVKSKIEWAEDCGFTSVDSGVAMLHPKHLLEVLDKVRSDMSTQIAS